ncbi:Endothelin-converting enzyme 1 protein [Dioscorea alata]|uniref:Endothelin-converting enzyme 1 protein n=1 Tax=Dioscorea alata TaxID=55571 RepID=A0ACB7W6H8_DIOAL|nr:Endothelin-converting enzyme 1 protein [Dioscorea alata]
MAKRSGGGGEDIFEALQDFTSKENWDKFFTLRGSGDYFEWYANWRSIEAPLLSLLSGSGGTDLRILVPGCGSSSVSEKLYDAGYRQITNIDFSKVVVSDMLRRNVRSRPEMRWRVMDMTEMQFADGSFDIVLDKGGLDALMEPGVGSKLGSKYLKEVKRVLKLGGKYLCLTLAESHVIGLIFTKFRFGWETSISAMPHEPGGGRFQTFLVTIVKENLDRLNPVISSFDESFLDYDTAQVSALVSLMENENKIREKTSCAHDILYNLEDLLLGAKGNIKELQPGRRCSLILGEQGDSLHSYKTVILDAKQQPDPFLYHCGVFIVPKIRAHEWLFTSEEGQWLVVGSSKAARLIMIFLDSSHSLASMDDIQKDLSPLVKTVAPGEPADEAKIPFMMANDGVKQRSIVKQVTSPVTGPIIVEDVVYENSNGDNSISTVSDAKIFRRLTFERSSGLVQSEALLRKESSQMHPSEEEKKRSVISSKSRKKGGKKRSDSRNSPHGSSGNYEVDHTILASSYHSGIICGFALIASSLESASSLRKKVKTVIIGLGAGLLPMFLHGCLPFLDIEVVELDPVIFDLAKDCFGFVEDKELKVHIGDGIKFIQDSNISGSSKAVVQDEKRDSDANAQDGFAGIKILIIDADSSDLSSGLTCPPTDFIEEPFLLSVKKFLSGGLFVANLVSRSTGIRETVISRIKSVFTHVFSLELEEDVNEVLFASDTAACIEMDHLPEATAQLQRLLKIPLPGNHIVTENIKCLN